MGRYLGKSTVMENVLMKAEQKAENDPGQNISAFYGIAQERILLAGFSACGGSL